MHELSYVLDIINSVNDLIANQNVKSVEKIRVEVGEMSGVVPFYLQKYFAEAKKGTKLEQSDLEIEEKKVLIECEACKMRYNPVSQFGYKCPECGERKGKLLEGRGIIIKEVVVEDVE